MKPFTKQEIVSVGAILFVLAVATLTNLRVAIRRARDAQRRADLGAISNALHQYQADFGFFPPSIDGKIQACRAENFDEVLNRLAEVEFFDRTILFDGLRGCEWGSESLSNLGLPESELFNYLENIFQDPKEKEGLSYLYLSNTKRFQLYAYLEGGDTEVGYDLGIAVRNLACGSKVCSFGKTFADTPLDKSIEEYEAELLEKLESGTQ
jgi:type II secretory pathway pseudopilin PulG